MFGWLATRALIFFINYCDNRPVVIKPVFDQAALDKANREFIINGFKE